MASVDLKGPRTKVVLDVNGKRVVLYYQEFRDKRRRKRRQLTSKYVRPTT